MHTCTLCLKVIKIGDLGEETIPDSKYDSQFAPRVRPDYEFLNVCLVNWQNTSPERVGKSANLVFLGLCDVFMEPLITTQISYQRKIMPNYEIKMKYRSFTDS